MGIVSSSEGAQCRAGACGDRDHRGRQRVRLLLGQSCLRRDI